LRVVGCCHLSGLWMRQEDSRRPVWEFADRVQITHSVLEVCLWCKRPFRPRRGGSPKRFCCAAHRIAFWSAARRWAEKAVASGVLSVGDIRNGAGEACTPLPGAGPPALALLPQKSAAVAPGERPDEPRELPDDP
jgi:hypothetical protein